MVRKKTLVVSEYVDGFVYNKQGDIIYNQISRILLNNEIVEISLENVDVVTSSFLNSAFVRFTDYLTFNEFKQKLIFKNGQPHVINMIKDRIIFAYQSNSKKMVNR